MALIRQFIGILYMLAILILALDVIYNLLYGVIPFPIKTYLASSLETVEWTTQIVCYPVVILVNYLSNLLPVYIKQILPVTQTNLLDARIAWVPLISLFAYTYILKAIDDFYLSKKFDFIKKRYDSDDNTSTNKN